MAVVTHPPKWNYSQIKGVTQSVLQDMHPDLAIPIPIEEIVEIKMEIKLNVKLSLKERLDIDGFIHTNFKEITLDNDTFNNFEQRTRFTIAHELGHIILHKKIYEQFNIESEEDYVKFQQRVSGDDHYWLEKQANMFAGCILVPTEPLKKAIEEEMKLHNVPHDYQVDYSLPFLENLPKKFNVSPEVLFIRIKKEGLLKGL